MLDVVAMAAALCAVPKYLYICLTTQKIMQRQWVKDAKLGGCRRTVVGFIAGKMWLIWRFMPCGDSGWATLCLELELHYQRYLIAVIFSSNVFWRSFFWAVFPKVIQQQSCFNEVIITTVAFLCGHLQQFILSLAAESVFMEPKSRCAF